MDDEPDQKKEHREEKDRHQLIIKNQLENWI